ncbi:MAG: glycosyltransferase family 4 protein [Vicinamibacteraceae bacterium]
MLRVTALTRGRDSPAARFRVRQYAAPLMAHGIRLDERYPRVGGVPPERRWLRPAWAVGAIVSRLPAVIASHRGDLTLLLRELFPTAVTLEPLTREPRVLDVDDAIWLHRRGRFVHRLARMANVLVCGNDFLAEHLGQWNRNIEILPTAVDTDVFVPPTRSPERATRIGWVGTSSNLQYLEVCAPALESVLRRHPDVELCVVCDRAPSSPSLRRLRLRYVPWSPQAELDLLGSSSVGVMPLHDSLWARGKCSFKMLLYMACGIPVVVSPVGMNTYVLGRGNVGFAAASVREWEEALETLMTDRAAAEEMGREGRRVVQEEFSVRTLAPRLARILKRAAGCPPAP